MHNRLRGQLQSLAPGAERKPELAQLLKAISQCYRQADADRSRLSRLADLFPAEAGSDNSPLTPERLLKNLVSLVETSLSLSPDGMLLVDERQCPLLSNPAFLDMFEVPDRDSLFRSGTGWKDRIRGLLIDAGSTLLTSASLPSTESRGELLKLKDGRLIQCHCYPDACGEEPTGCIWTFADITPSQKQNPAVRRWVYHDDLTGLANRNQLRALLELLVAADDREPMGFAVLLLDLDGFKYVNDSLGLEQGDEVLQQVAQRLAGQTPDNATLTRYGADEFIIVLHDTDNRAEVNQIAEDLRQALEQPFRVDDHEVHLSSSIGISMHPEDGNQADILIRNADMAMHHAKARGRNNHQFFSEELAELTAHRLHIRNHLRQALTNDEFHLLYQPKIDLSNHRIIGVEALIRWQRPDGEIINPAHFIPAAEENGLIIPISDWVLDRVCRQLEEWESIIDPEFSVAVNISAVHFQRGNVLRSLEQAMRKYATPVSQVQLEITEGVVMQDLARATRLLREIRDRGMRTAIDDFGTGYSSLNYLKALPVDILKVDKSFIDDLAYSARGMNLVRTIIQLAHDLDMEVVAEGIESESIARFLASHGCDIAQGYFFSKPLSPEETTALLQRVCFGD